MPFPKRGATLTDTLSASLLAITLITGCSDPSSDAEAPEAQPPSTSPSAEAPNDSGEQESATASGQTSRGHDGLSSAQVAPPCHCLRAYTIPEGVTARVAPELPLALVWLSSGGETAWHHASRPAILLMSPGQVRQTFARTVRSCGSLT